MLTVEFSGWCCRSEASDWTPTVGNMKPDRCQTVVPVQAEHSFSLTLKGRLRSFASEKKTFSAFHCAGWRVAAVRERAATGGLKRCEEIMGPFTLFRLTWGGASQTCDGDVTFILPSLSLSHISTPDCSSDSESAESLMTERRREDGSGAEKGKKSSLASDKCELEASEAPRCADSKVSYPTKQQVHGNYSAWPRAAGSLWVFVEKRSSGGFLHKSTKTREERKERFPSSTLDPLRAKLLFRSFSSCQTCHHITAA